MPADKRASLKALTSTKKFINADDVVAGYRMAFGSSFQGTPWFNNFVIWFWTYYGAFLNCTSDGQLITLIVE